MDFEEDTTFSLISSASTVEAPSPNNRSKHAVISSDEEAWNNSFRPVDTQLIEIENTANPDDVNDSNAEEIFPEIYILPDIVDINPEFNLLKCLYNQVKPSQVVTSARVTSKFLVALKNLMHLPNPESEDEFNGSNQTYEAKLFCLPRKDFYFDPCRRRVLGIHLPYEPKGMSEEEHSNYIHSLVDMSAETMVQALGALLFYLDRTWAEVNLQAGVRSPPILDVNLITLDDIVIIDSSSYEALQIFSQKCHPSNFKKWAPGSNKEGLSVFGIFNRCKSQQGCLYMRLIFMQISDCATEDLQRVAHYIYSVIDFEESEAQNKFVVKMGLDEELDKLKQKHFQLSNLMSKVAEQELLSLPPEVEECSLMYLPEIGYILCLPMWKENMDDADFNIPGLEFKFMANRMAHYKSARCKEMDNVFGDFFVQVMAHELRIMVKLVEFILEHLSPVIKLVKHAAELDCLIALATVARENGYVRPMLTDERIIEIHGGRHLLQELCMDEFVPNDTFSSERIEWGFMKVLTGPNSSGKSVYLKQVALITFLAHIGSFVPADSAKIGIIDSIYTRITTTESISLQLSAFMIDLCQVSNSVNCSSPSSLVIIDEFGKGTSELDGLSLLIATLEHFLSRGSNCPHVLVSTHFHNIANMLTPSPYLVFQTMNHMFDGDQIVYLYKLKNGGVNSSFAHHAAMCVGIDPNIIRRSKQACQILMI
ncbi:mutS protein homolog 5-like [Hetaerina americana]|uniref:mutS protein homolog 5-like n=1 Tax=Hetaerina americana TaxID=62018 RepID=UPI003A7F1A16